jgi:hypothetical protein
VNHLTTLVDGLEEFDALANDNGGVFSSDWIGAQLLSLLSQAVGGYQDGKICCLLIENRNSCLRSGDELLTDFNGAFTLVTSEGVCTFQKSGEDIALLTSQIWASLNQVCDLWSNVDDNGATTIYFGDPLGNTYLWGGNFFLGMCEDESLYIDHLNDSRAALAALTNEKNSPTDSTPKIADVAEIQSTLPSQPLKDMASNTIFEYFEFLEQEDENYKGNFEIVDDGSEALYCILFKLMGDTRTFESLCSEFLEWPTATELKYAAQEGDYASLLAMMRDHDCGMLENSATMEISSKIIKNLESCIPDFRDCIIRGDSAKDPDFLNKVYANCYSNKASSTQEISMLFMLTIYDSYKGDGIFFDKKIFSPASYLELKSALNNHWADLIECGFLAASEDNEYDLIHVESGTVVEGHLMAYQNESDADNGVNYLPFQNSQFFSLQSGEITSGTCWDEISDRLEYEDDALQYWGLEDTVKNPPEELKNSYDDEFFTALFDFYRAAASRA